MSLRRRPHGLPRHIPAWAWKRLRFPGRKPQKGPRKLPAWFWSWRAWRLHLKPVVIHVRHPRNRSSRAIALADRFVGVKEYPPGSNVQEFGRWYGEDGVPWCAIFVSYVLSHAGVPFRYAYVPAIVADARAAKNGLRPLKADQVNSAVKSGDVVLACFDWPPQDGVADHVGIVRSIQGGNVNTIEGNTGNNNWSNGGEVLRETRPIGDVELFVRVI